MKVLICDTKQSCLRSEIVGWTQEDSNLFVKGKPIGYTPSPKYDHPKTILEALANGWKLLGAPVKETPNYWTWWLQKG